MDLSGLPWGTLSPMAVLLLVVILIVRGDLVPRKIHEETKVERDFYRNIATERSRQLATLLPSVETTNKLVQSLVETRTTGPRPDGEEP